MFAVIRTGGKQYGVIPGQTIEVEKLPGIPGDTFNFSDVLLVVDGDMVEVGRPAVRGARVTAQIIEQRKGKKLIAYKKVRRHGYHRKRGHRQILSRVKIHSIVVGGAA